MAVVFYHWDAPGSVIECYTCIRALGRMFSTARVRQVLSDNIIFVLELAKVININIVDNFVGFHFKLATVILKVLPENYIHFTKMC